MDTQKNEFNEWVASVESTFAKSWVPVERYVNRHHDGSKMYVEVVSGIVTRHYYVNGIFDTAKDLSMSASSFVGKQSWGLKLQSEWGFRKLPQGLWVNTLTGEMSALSPLEMEMRGA